MNPSDESLARVRWRELIDRHLSGEISDDESRELEAALAARREARDDFRLRCNVDTALRQESTALAGETPAPATSLSNDRARAASRWFTWFSWRPLAAAAAGIVFGMFCTSVVYGFVTRSAGRVVPLVVMNAGFESGNGPLKPGYSRRVAEWTGSGVLAGTPDGRRCARLAPVLPLNVKSRAGVLLQTVDLETMGASQVSEGARLVVSAKINASFLPATGMRQFALRILTFSQTAAEVLENSWPDLGEDAEANVVRTLAVDSDRTSWETLRTRLELPPGTRSIAIQISGPRIPIGADLDELPTFWVDDVQAHLEVPQEGLR